MGGQGQESSLEGGAGQVGGAMENRETAKGGRALLPSGPGAGQEGERKGGRICLESLLPQVEAQGCKDRS